MSLRMKYRLIIKTGQITLLLLFSFLASGGCGGGFTTEGDSTQFKFIEHPEAYKQTAGMPDFDEIVTTREEKIPWRNRTMTIARRGFSWDIAEPIVFEVDLPPSPVLTFEWGFPGEVPTPGVEYKFTVMVEQNDLLKVVGEYDETISPDKNGSMWRSRKIELKGCTPGIAEIKFYLQGLDAEIAKNNFLLVSPVLYSDSRKNIRRVILIGVDTLRADHMSCYDYDRDTSPVIDDWAEGGTRFEYCVATSPWTYPSFSSIFTGRYPSVCGATTNVRVLPDSEETLAEVLSGDGFSTFMVANNVWLHPPVNLHQGFDRAEAYFAIDASETFDKAREWLRNHEDEDTFIFLHFMDPHIPYAPPAPFTDKFDSGYSGRFKDTFSPIKKLRTGEIRLNEKEIRHLEALYDGEIAYLDSEFGKFMDFLDAEDMAESSLIIFSADHGEEFHEHGDYAHGHSLYDEQLHVPLIIRGPGIPTGEVDKRVASTIDIFPTVLDFLGLSIPENISGASLLKPLPDDRLIISEQLVIGEELKGITTPEYRYIYHTVTGEDELYVLDEDAGMQNSIASDRRATCRSYRAFLTQYILDMGAPWHINFMRGGRKDRGLTYSGKITCSSGFADVDTKLFGDNDLLITEEGVIEFSLTVEPATEKEISFVPNDESAEVLFELSLNDAPMTDGDIFIGPDIERMIDAEFSLTANDRRFSLGQPNLRRDVHDGIFIWAIPTRYREQIQPDLTQEMVDELHAIGYLN